MGEIFMSNEILEFQEMETEHNSLKKICEDTDVVKSCVEEWKKFVPKMAVKILLVESDNSTRQIIAALLRKCSYKVASVSDGLKAWELMKANPHSIDLILTEVELPSISGYALLTLIMEHDVCKNIPVIMMSLQDSISTVYKCMLKGATDFLVKPLRKNELMNLWQHVWRKQVSSTGAGLGPPDKNLPQQKVEKSDAESSSTKPESKTEETDSERDICLSDNISIPVQEESHLEEFRGVENEDDPVRGNSSRVAIDLMGAVDSYLKSTSSNVSTNKFEILLQLDLSLKRSHPDGSLNQVDDERCINHSDASPFSRYVNKPLHCDNANQHETLETNPEKQLSNYTPDYTSDYTLRQSEITFSYPQKRDISNPIPVRGERFENVTNDSMMSQTYRVQLPENPQQFHNLMDQRISDAIDQIEYKQGDKSENVEDQSGNSSFCIGNSHNQRISFEDNGKINEISIVKATSVCGSEEGSHRSIREAALMKFRLKRKDRCFEKKVRYESRKKLAEQRPRVKGQFVRQATNDSI